MKTLLMIRNEAAKLKGYKTNQSATELRALNPEGAKRIAELIKSNMPDLVREISCAIQK